MPQFSFRFPFLLCRFGPRETVSPHSTALWCMEPPSAYFHRSCSHSLDRSRFLKQKQKKQKVKHSLPLFFLISPFGVDC